MAKAAAAQSLYLLATCFVPTPECDPVHGRLNLRIPSGKESQAGKVIKRLYAVRYGDSAASRIPNRNVPFRGQISPEIAYW